MRSWATLMALRGAAGEWDLGRFDRARRMVLLLLAGTLGALVFMSAPALAAAPSVSSEYTSSPATPSVEARLEATVNAGEEAAGITTECHFQYGASSVTEHEDVCEQGNTLEGGEQGVAVTVKGLTAGTTYSWRVVLKNVSGEIEGNPEEFTTLPVPATEVPSSIGTTTATFKGTLAPLNAIVPAEYYFLYNVGEEIVCTGEHATGIESAGTGSGLANVSTAVTELEPHQKYAVCLLSTNTLGDAEEDLTPRYFTTLAAAPTIVKETVSGVESTTATLEAEINPGGAATTTHFEYLPQAQYEADGNTFGEHTISTPESASVGSNDSIHPAVPARIAEQGQPPLEPSTTYRYRVVATSTCEDDKHCVTDGPDKTFTTYPAPGSEPPQNCTNEARRSEQSSIYLPDCRAYELVTPAEKGSGEPAVKYGGIGTHAAADGDRMAWFAQSGIPGSETVGLDYLSARGPDGWSTENVIPPQSVENGIVCPENVGMDAWSANLEKGVLADGLFQGSQQPGGFETGANANYECGHDEPRLVAGELELFQNLFVRDNENFVRDGEIGVDPYQLVDVTPSAVSPPTSNGSTHYYAAFFLAGSADLSHIVFEEELPLTENAPGYPDEWQGHDDTYEWTASGVRLVTLLPDGTAVEGSLAGATKNAGELNRYNIADYRHAVSEAIPAQGSRVFFQAGGNLYMRENTEREQSAIVSGSPLVNGEQCSEPEKACTIQVDAAQGSAPGPAGGGVFMQASETGSQVFFTDENRLTSDSTAQSGKPDLYEYDLEKPVGERLIDLTVDTGEPADVLGLSGAGEDGSRVYFVADGVLSAAPDRSLPAGKQTPVAGEPNLYAYEPDPAHPGAYRTVFIATLASGDSCDWIEIGCGGNESGLTARVSANGDFLGFTSSAQLTSYDNTDDSEIYLYDAATETLGCASCDPSGAAPTAGGAAIGPPVEPYNVSEVTDAYPQRYVSNEGQVFFDSSEALLPTATNAQQNVYEYEGGELHLISSGTSDEGSYFLDASVDGSDVFFETSQQLAGETRDAAYAIYDARVNGGFPEQSVVSPGGPPCEKEACKPPPSEPPIESFPASSAFSGAGNIVSPPPPPPGVKPKSKPLTRAQKLAKALKVCAKDKQKSKRAECRKQAKQKYGALKAKQPAKTNRRGK